VQKGYTYLSLITGGGVSLRRDGWGGLGRDNFKSLLTEKGTQKGSEKKGIRDERAIQVAEEQPGEGMPGGHTGLWRLKN